MLRLALRTSRGSYVLHAMPSHRGDIDHVVIGTNGIFAVETKGFTGVVRLVDGTLTCNGHTPDRNPLHEARRAATAVCELLAGEDIDLQSVDPVVCLPYASLDRPQCCDGVLVARPGQLEYLIRHWRGQVMSEAAAARAFAVLRAHAPRRAAA